MANKNVFAPPGGHPVRSRNAAGGRACDDDPRARLAHLAITGCLSDGSCLPAGSCQPAGTQLDSVLTVARAVPPAFVARAAVYAREAGAMQEVPALLAAFLTVAEPELAMPVFARVIDNGCMLRRFVQIVRSGRIGRRSLGSRPKRLVRAWLDQASTADLMAMTGQTPGLVDIVRMVHPKPASAERRAFYGWLLGKPHDSDALPPAVAAFEAWRRRPAGPLPPVPFSWLAHYPLSPAQWDELAGRMDWQAPGMNLDMLGRQGAFAWPGVTARVAARLADPAALRKPRPRPFQLLTTLRHAGDTVPRAVRAALKSALEVSLETVPVLQGHIVLCADVSGSMRLPVTGYRRGASSRLHAVDVVALVVAALLRRNPRARVLPFAWNVVDLTLDPAARIGVNAARLAAVCGGGTTLSAPLARLNREGSPVDTIVVVSDNQSWTDKTPARQTTTAMAQWQRLKARNPGLRMVCIDIQPDGTTRAPAGDGDIMNIGGFTDAVFDAMARFARREVGSQVDMVERVTI